MKGKPKKNAREKDITARYLGGGMDMDRVDQQQRFGDKSKHYQQRKTERTAVTRAAEESIGGDVDALPVGDIIQVHSRYCEVQHGKTIWLCNVRRTLTKVSEGFVLVGDRVHFRDGGTFDEQGRPEAIIEKILPRRTLLTRADSFKAIEAQPIVANADQVLIVAALAEPWPKWGLIDRMIVAALGGGLTPIVCLNKADLAETAGGKKELELALAAIDHYQSMGIATLKTSVPANVGLDALRAHLKDKLTVLAGHSGVGKSSLIKAIQPSLDLRIAAISGYTGKGRHTTTSSQRFPLDGGGYVIDTPGVKLFGLWNVTRENLLEFFPDVKNETAPTWRRESYERIVASLHD
jgi:ribosome biogenesis GTPase